MNWCKEKNVLILETGKRINFDFPIKGVVDGSTLTFIGVELDIPTEKKEAENFYSISKKTGEIKAKYIVAHSAPPNYSKGRDKEVEKKCVMDWGKEGETLIIQNEKRVTFDYPIGMIFETCGVLLVVLDVPPKQSMAENIFAVSIEGEFLWQIEHSPKTGTDPTNRYTGIGDSSIPGIVVASNWNCTNFYIDVQTGKIVDTEFTK